MTTRQNGSLALGFAVTALVWILGGWGICVRLSGRSDSAARWEAALALAVLAAGSLTVLWYSIVRRRRERWDRLRALVPSAATAGDEASVVERLVSERNEAAGELRRLTEELEALEAAVEARLQGTAATEWPRLARMGDLARRVETVFADRAEDAGQAADVLGLWIERLERLRLRLEILRRTGLPETPATDALREGGERTGGEEPKELSASSSVPLSHSLHLIEAELARLEEAARALRRRLGGIPTDELDDGDFIP